MTSAALNTVLLVVLEHPSPLLAAVICAVLGFCPNFVFPSHIIYASPYVRLVCSRTTTTIPKTEQRRYIYTGVHDVCRTVSALLAYPGMLLFENNRNDTKNGTTTVYIHRSARRVRRREFVVGSD